MLPGHPHHHYIQHSGFSLPGVNLYVACGIGKIKIEEITKGIVPCLVAELVVLLLVTYIPALSTMLVG